MINWQLINMYPQLVAMLQVISTGAAEKLLDELFSSTPARLVFMVMIASVISIPIMLFFFLRILNRSLTASAQNQDKLLTVIQNYQTFLNNAQEHNNENYLMIRTYIEKLQGMFTTVNTAIITTQSGITSNISAVGDLLLKTTTLHAETRQDVKTAFERQLKDALENILDQRRIDMFEEFQAPAEDDCRYKIRLVRSAPTPDDTEEARDILLYKAPIFKNGNEAGRLRGSGEVVRIITDTVFPGWGYLKQLYGDERVGGYARLKSLSIIELPDNPVTIHKES